MKSLEYYCKQNNCQYIERNVSNSCVFVNELVKDSTLVDQSCVSMQHLTLCCIVIFYRTRLEVILSDVNKVS